jgi:outer membrane usher protein
MRKHNTAWLCMLAFNLPHCVLAAETGSTPVSGAEVATPPPLVEFDPAFLDQNGPQNNVDLSIFSNGNRVLPGTYPVDLYLNNNFLLSRNLQFEAQPGQQNARPCLTAADAERFGLKKDYEAALAESRRDRCLNLDTLLPAAQLHYDSNHQRLDISVPQAYLAAPGEGMVSQKRWDKGINSAQVNYNLNATHQSTGNSKSDLVYGSLNSGANLGGWRLRNQSSLTQDANQHTQLKALQSWIGNDVDALHSQLRIGDSTTSGVFADSLPFRGLQMWYDKDMDPDNLQNFAPTLRGVAKSNAKITVSQNGNIIDTRYVAPGPFAIDDLALSSGNGDLTVVVTESDGSKHSFVQPYASLPVMLRPGGWDYNFSAGQMRDSSTGQHPNFSRLSLAHGLGDGTTLYGGLTVSQDYQAWLLGASRVLGPIGALSLDMTEARAQLNNRTYQGAATRLQYTKSLPTIGSQIQLSTTFYSNLDYLSLGDAARLRAGEDIGMDQWVKHKEQLSLSQNLGRWGSLSISATRNSYWTQRDTDVLTNINYNTQIGRASVGLYYYKTANALSSAQSSFGLNVSFPLDPVVNRANVTLMANQDNTQLGISGSALEDDTLSYSVAASNGNRSDSGGNASLNYNASAAQLSASVSNSGNNTQSTLGIAGSALLHGGGLTLGQPLYGAAVLVHAPNAEGMKIENQPGTRVDSDGYALVSSARQYRDNRIALDMNQVPNSVDIKQSVVSVVPRHNAVVQAEFKVARGDKVVAHITRNDGLPIPFGSQILDARQRQVSLMGEDGMAYLTGLKNGQSLRVRWGTQLTQGCNMVYNAPSLKLDAPFLNIDMVCIASQVGAKGEKP